MYIRNYISKNLRESPSNKGAYEIMKINFVGNNYFSSAELLEYINSKQSSISIPNKILSTYHRQSKLNKTFPVIITNALENSLNQFANEYKYFSKEVVKNDIETIISIYNTSGFHFADAYFTFLLDSNNLNTLTFYINENQIFKLADKINYSGFDNLPKDIQTRINATTLLKKGDVFNEELIENEMLRIHSILLRNGYINSSWNYPYVIMDSINMTDSVIVYFNLGNRIKVGEIIFSDINDGQKIVANSAKKKLIRFASGDYYSNSRINRSMDNMLAMGVFESVNIDTLERDYGDNDTIRDFVVTSKYRKQKDWELGLSLNRTQIDDLINIGVDGELLHRNLFGSAQLTKLFAGFSFKDVNRFVSNFTFPDYEFNIGINYSQPILWEIENSRISLSSSLVYSLEVLNRLFRISKISFPISFPVRLPYSSYFSNLNIVFEINREVPLNYDDVVLSALDSAKTIQDTNNILSSLMLYYSINNYLNEPNIHLFTSNLISVTFSGDDRDNAFSPTKGSQTIIGIDGFNFFFSHPMISGGAKYFRGQITHNHFWKLSEVLVLGMKGKLGLTYLFDETNAFVPHERQFFCGGANSVRAWSARQLRYSNPSLLNNTGTVSDFSKMYIGSRTLIEGSVELRRNLSDLPGISDDIKWLVNDLGLGLFLDCGNTFGWYAEDSNNKPDIKYYDYITKLAVGCGIGLRYETPIGPIRIDIATPLYDPMQQRRAFWDLTFVFGIGHSF